MRRTTRWALLFTFVIAMIFVASTLTQKTSSQSPQRGAKRTEETQQPNAKSKGPIAQDQKDRQGKSLTSEPEQPSLEDEDDPDLPPGMAGRIDKEAYLRARGDYFDLLRGRPFNLPFDPREKALKQMEKQEAQVKERVRNGLMAPISTSTWSSLGPAPIPLGQTSTTRVPVSGRTIAIAVHPTDPDTVYVGTAQGGLYKSTNGGANWTKLFEFEFETLAIGAITIDPTDSSIVYIGTGETSQSADSFLGRGLYIIRSANSATPTLAGPFRQDGLGNNVFNFRSIGKVVVNPLDHNTIFVATTNGTGGNPNTTVLPSAPPRGLYRSTNAQSASPTFAQVPVLPTPYDRSAVDVVIDPNNPNLVIASLIGVTGDGGIYRSTDALAPVPTFTRTLTLPDASTNGRAKLYLNSGAQVVVFAATGEVSSAALGGPACPTTAAGLARRSTDGGMTWSTPLPGSTGFCGGQCFYDITIAATPDNQTIHLGGAARGGSGSCLIEVMKRSTNGGTTFVRNDNTLHADEHALAIAPSNPLVVYTGSDGGIWRSGDNGTTWVSRNNMDFSATQFQGVAVHPFDRFFLMGGTQDNGTNCLAADGVTWSHCRDGDGGYAVIDDNAPDTFNVLMYHTFFNQTNSQIGFERASNTLANADGQLSGWTFRGCSGTTSNNNFRCADNVLFYAPMAQGPGSPNTIYFGTDRLYRSTNRGDTMALVSQGPLVPTSPGATSGIVVTTIGISPQNDNVRIVGLRNGQVFATTTGSSTLTNVTGVNFPAPNPADLLRNSIGRAVIDPNNSSTAYVTFTSFSPPLGQQIFKTTNLGDPAPTWTPSSNGIPTVPVSALVVDPQDSNILFAGTDIGVYQSTDGGANWAPYGTALPRVAVFDVKLSNVQRLLRIATHGRGIWEIGVAGQQLPVLRNAGSTLVAESCDNGVIDPNETVSVRLGISNIGAGPTSNLMVTLQSTGGVVSPSGPESYGAIAAGTTVTRDFQFSNNGSCGGTITLTFHLQDGMTDLGNYTVTFTLGQLVTSAATFTENFDGVAAPALPAGWTSTKTPPTGNPVLWATNVTLRDTVPNSAFSAGSTTAGESLLISPAIAVPTPPAFGSASDVRLSFKTNYNTEAGFDGGVLEVSINGGAFQDIVTAGGTFLEGGYSGVIDPTTDSTLAGRQAWTGNSAGFITSTVLLPPSSFGQNAQFRWRAAYDSGTSPAGGGLRIDTLTVFASTRVCCGLASAASSLVNESCAPANNQIDPGERVTVNLSLTNNSAASTTNLVATLLSTGGVVAPSGPQTYGAVASAGTAGRDFSFTASPTLSPGQTITATLQLQDGASNLGTASFSFTAGPAPCGGIRLVVTSSLVRTGPTTVEAAITVQNIGTLPADNTILSTARLGATNGTPLPQSLGSIAPGGSATSTVQFTNSTPGASSTLSTGGIYTGGTFSSTKRVTIP